MCWRQSCQRREVTMLAVSLSERRTRRYGARVVELVSARCVGCGHRWWSRHPEALAMAEAS